MMKNVCLSVLMALTLVSSAQAWTHWDQFKSSHFAAGRVIDFNDERLITTSEGQSYALFFALVANDRATFDAMLGWTEKHLANGSLSKHLPAWLWGQSGETGAVIDSNNAVDSDMWIAYVLLEAGRLWNDDRYSKKGQALLKLLKSQVRYVNGIGQVLLPGRVGFEKDETITLNTSYYPLMLLRRFAVEDAYWQSVFDGCLRATLRSAPNGYAPDWVTFDKDGHITKTSDAVGSYNAIRVYLWAGMMSSKDPVREILKNHFAPMVRSTERFNVAVEKVDVNTAQANDSGSLGFAASVLPLMDQGKSAELIRTYLMNAPIIKDNYYGNVLTLFGLGFDQKYFAFDQNGYVYFPNHQRKVK